MTKKTQPDVFPSFLCLYVNNNNKIAAKIANAPSNKNSALNGIGNIKPAMPRTNSILKMFEPTMLPIAISDSPLRAAIILVTNSGKLVPNATTVNPITRSDIPIYCAISTADSTVILLPNINATIPKMINNAILVLVICFIPVSVSVLPRATMNK